MESGLLKRFLMLLAAVSFLCMSCGRGKAASMWLAKTEGTVAVADDEGKSIEPETDLKLYSGYDMTTQEVSYAWINLDNEKLAKMDESSEIEIQKDGKALKIQVENGSLYFNITEPLKEDETMDIHTSSMIVGIRGTCGWTASDGKNHSQIYILEGTVSVTGTKSDKSFSVTSGQMADVTVDDDGKTVTTIGEFSEEDIPDYVMEELLQDEELAAKILALSYK